MEKALTPELIVHKTKTDQFDKIKSLNLWGNEISDLSILKELKNVEVLSLSVNKISSLVHFSNCIHLTELYLRKNNISNLGEIQHLKNLKQLKVLWLWDNPICEQQNLYRPYIIHVLPHLMKLDNLNVTQEEKDAALKLNFDPTSISYSVPIKDNNVTNQISNFEMKEEHRDKPIMKRANTNDQVNKIGIPNERKENIVSAIFSLLNELDINGLELVKREIEKKLKY